MIKPTALLSWLMPSCCAAGASDPATFQALLDPKNIGVLSAACCDSTAAAKDEALMTNLRQALQAEGDQRAVIQETITAAQKHIRTLQADAGVDQHKLVGSVVALFQANGLSIFPMLIVDGRVAYYGGAPTVEAIRERLQSRSRVLAGSGA